MTAQPFELTVDSKDAAETLQPLGARDLERRNAGYFSQILKSQRNSATCLPFKLGLSDIEFQHFKHFIGSYGYQTSIFCFENSDTRQELLELRADEFNDLYSLFLDHKGSVSDTELWAAKILTAACFGSEHLWRDLGLESRKMLASLINDNFPRLFEKNEKDMKWKKFFYKQLCEQEGAYVCRAPTCEECKAYDDCFGSEE